MYPRKILAFMSEHVNHTLHINKFIVLKYPFWGSASVIWQSYFCDSFLSIYWKREKETLACNPTILQSFWLVRCWWWQIKNALDWYLFESYLCQGLSDLSPFKV